MKKSRLRQYFGKGLFYFLVVAACIVFFFAFWRFEGIRRLYDKLKDILMPIILGFAFAYLLNPLMKTVERPVGRFLSKRMKNRHRSERLARGIGIFAALVIGIAIVCVLIGTILPELVRNIWGLLYEIPSQIDSFVDWFESLEQTDSGGGQMLATIVKEVSDYFEDWVRDDLLKQVNVWMSTLTEGVISFVGTLFDAVIGLIISAYVLSGKERFAGQCKKMLYALMKVDDANFMLGLVRKSNEIFGGFITGKLLDSFIIGVLCFIGLTILDMPYTLLISVVVGVTNVIPFFGPYIGGIPCIILMLLVDFRKGIYLAVFILVLQQIDGNIIGPKILGSSTGLTPFWVVFSILLGGGLFGFAGMLLGVPTFAVIYYVVQMFVDRRLEKKKLPTPTKDYQDLDFIRAEDNALVYSDDDGKKKEKDGGRKPSVRAGIEKIRRSISGVRETDDGGDAGSEEKSEERGRNDHAD